MTRKISKSSKKSELSPVLQQWLEPRIRIKRKYQDGSLTNEQARVDIIKDICIKLLLPLPLEVMTKALNRLAQLKDSDQLHLLERLLYTTPNPDMASGAEANVLREYLVTTLTSSNDGATSATSIEVEPTLMEVAKAVLEQSHNDWIGTCEAILTFLKDCTVEFDSERNVYILYPHLSDVSRNLVIEKEQRNSVEYFFACIQDVANSMGYKFKDIIRTEVSRDQKKVRRLMSELFPKGIQLENDDDPENIGKRRIRPPLLRPRWHNQQHLMHLALQKKSQDYTLARGDLIETAIFLDEKLSAETGLPRCFTGQSPRNSASACLTTNAGGYFTVFKKDPNQNTIYYKLSFIPNDRDDAIKRYNRWTNDIIVHDWPLCFGKPKKSRTGQNNINSGHNMVMLTVGLQMRCPDLSCDAKSPACSLGGPATATRNKRKLQQEQEQQVKQKRLKSGDPDELLNGLDLTNVPKKLSDIVEVRPSTVPNAGNGLFAKRDLPISTPLGFYFGVPIMENEFDQHKDKVGRASQYSMRYKHLILDATNDRGEPYTDPDGLIFCPFHFMNEDPSGNMVFLEGSEVNQVICWTKRDIIKGEELFVYYGGDVDHEHWGQAEVMVNKL